MEQSPSGTVIVTETTAPPASGVGLYARVSSPDRKNDLEAQLGRLTAYANSQGWTVVKSVTEIGPGLNGRRSKLMELLADPNIGTIVVEHRDRLMRFGAEYIEAALAAQGRKLIVVNPSEVKDDLEQDILKILTSFCTRLYGYSPQAARSRARKALQVMEAIGEEKK